MNLKKIKLKEIISIMENKPWIVFIFFGILIFILFRSLFGSYFEADEWFHFTYYLPLTSKPDGFFTAFISTIIDTKALTAGQHVSPVATVILFLSTKFFGINFPPYAFMSLLFHSVNSFLIFLFIKSLLYKKINFIKNLFGIIGGIFFAIAPTPIHTVTGAAAFYSYNILSVTFFLLCVLSFKIAYNQRKKKYIYFSVIFLFFALFSKETAVFLFILLPFMTIIEKRVFPLKFLGKVFTISLVIYLIFRFVIPNFNTFPGKIIDKFTEGYIPKSYTQPVKVADTGTIVSNDLSIHKNLPAEILFRSITFPIKTTGTLFFPRQTVFSIVQFLTPIVQPVPPGGDSADSSQARLTFLYGPGNGFIIYIASLGILIFCASLIFEFIRKRKTEEARALATGLVIILLSALPLVAIIFSFPRWGYDFYFDSRHYYNPNVGAAIVFPFLLFGIARFLSKKLRTSLNLLVIVLFIIWLINNMNMLNLGIKQFTQNFQPDRRKVISQLKNYLPMLSQKTVFYIETDGLSAYGPILPFQTSVPQALTVVYYDRSPLPDSFFEKPLFGGKTEGYQYSQGHGFGYYTSKKNLSEAIIAGKFKSSNIYAFYYKSKDVRLLDTTSKIRSEMEDYLKFAQANTNWKKFTDSTSGVSFSYPSETNIENLQNEDPNIVKSLSLKNPQFNIEMFVLRIPATFDLNNNILFQENGVPLNTESINEANVYFDKFHFNKAKITNEEQPRYFIKFNDMLVYVKTNSSDMEGQKLTKRILGSLEIIDEK